MHKCTNGHLTVVHDQEDEFKTFLHGMGYLNKKCQMFTMPGPKTSLSLLCCLALVLKNKIFTLLHQSFSRSLHNIHQKSKPHFHWETNWRWIWRPHTCQFTFSALCIWSGGVYMCFSLKIVQITEVNLISVRDPQQFAKREDLFANFVQNSYKVGIVSFQYEDDTKF